MNNLITITEKEGKKLVSARELHKFLEVGRDFSTWLKARIEKYKFEENIDFTVFTKSGELETTGFQEKIEYVITIDMAKELSMVENNDKGREARKYFIACEKQLVEIQSISQLLLNIYNGGQAAVIASKQLTEIEVAEATKPLLNTIEEQKPLVEFGNTILKSKDNILVRELAKIISDEVVSIGQNKLYDKMRAWGMIMAGKTEPYQRYVDNKYFVLEEKPVSTPYGEKIVKTTLVSPRGQVAIVEKFRKEFVS